MAKFDYVIKHVPGKLLYTADMLLRASTSKAGEESRQLQEEVETFVESVTSTPPASKQRLEMYRKAQAQDAVYRKVQEYHQTGWPRKHILEPTLQPYLEARGSLTLCNGLLLYDDHSLSSAERIKPWRKSIQDIKGSYDAVSG